MFCVSYKGIFREPGHSPAPDRHDSQATPSRSSFWQRIKNYLCCLFPVHKGSQPPPKSRVSVGSPEGTQNRVATVGNKILSPSVHIQEVSESEAETSNNEGGVPPSLLDVSSPNSEASEDETMPLLQDIPVPTPIKGGNQNARKTQITDDEEIEYVELSLDDLEDKSSNVILPQLTEASSSSLTLEPPQESSIQCVKILDRDKEMVSLWNQFFNL
jgi:hypothetical protein